MTRDGTQALLDFLAETEREPPPCSDPSSATGTGRATGSATGSATGRGPPLGALERAKGRLGLLSLSLSASTKKKKKVEEEGEKGCGGGCGVLRISTPPPGTVAITRNSG